MSTKLWGVNPTLLRLWYLSVTEKILTYASSVWGLELNVHSKRHLKSAQRPFLLQITRAYSKLSNQALSILAAVPPLDIRAKKIAKQARLLHFNSDFGKFKRSDYSPTFTQILDHPSFDLRHTFVSFSSINQSNYHIFTDGSRIQDKVGCAFVVLTSDSPSEPIYIWQAKLSSHNSVYQAEMYAILSAIRWANHNVYSSLTIHTDSQSSILSILKPENKNFLANQLIRSLYASIPIITVKWIKAHAGHLGNELADLYAKQATENETLDITFIPRPISNLVRQLESEMIDEWQHSWDTCAEEDT